MNDRLAELVEQFNRGAKELQALDERRARLRDGLLRLSGAIEALREMCEQTGRTIAPLGGDGATRRADTADAA